MARVPARAARRGVRAGLTVRGRCLLAGGIATALCAVVLDERDLLRVGLFACLLPLVSWLLALRSRRGVRAARSLVPARVPTGGEAEVRVELSGGPLLAAMRLADAVPEVAGPSALAPPRFTVHRIGSRGAGLTYPLRPILRGSHPIGPLTARAGGALGLSEFSRELAGPDRLLVLPQIAALHGVPRALGGGEGVPGAVAHQGLGSPDVLVRGYRQGDELRRVHWRSTARHDELMVRTEEQPWHAGVTVLLDRRDRAHAGHGPSSSLEFAVTMVASIALHLMRRGEPVTVVTEDGTVLGGTGAGRAGVAPGPAGLREADPLLDELAMLRPVARPDLAGPSLGAGTDAVAVLGACSPADAETLASRHPGRGYALLLDTASFVPDGAPSGSAGAGDGVGPGAGVLRAAGWHVVVVAHGTAPAEAWDALVRGAGTTAGSAAGPGSVGTGGPR